MHENNRSFFRDPLMFVTVTAQSVALKVGDAAPDFELTEQEGESTLRRCGRIERAILRIESGRDAIDITGVKSVCAALQ